MEKIFEFIDPGEIVSFYNHGTHVVAVSQFLDDRHTLEPHSAVLSHEEAEKQITELQDRQELPS